MAKKQCIKGGQTKNLTYQLSWIQNKPWHVYSKDLRGDLCKVYVLFKQSSGSKSRGKFVKTVFKGVGKSEEQPNMKQKSTTKMHQKKHRIF